MRDSSPAPRPRCALVLGATGLLGAQILDRFRRAGVRSLAIARSRERIEDDGEAIAADLTANADLAPFFAGADVAVLAASLVPDRIPHGTARRLAAEAHVRVVEALARAGVRRLVLVSAAPAHGLAATPLTEDAPLQECGDLCTDAKVDAERIALQAHRAGRLEVAIVRPVTCYGPGDRTFLPRLIADLAAGRSALVGGGLTPASLCHAGHVAQVCFAAATVHAAAGQAFHVRDGELSRWKDVLADVARAIGVGPPTGSIPVTVARLAAYACAALARIRGTVDPPWLTPHIVDVLTQRVPVSIDRARTVLGFSPSHSTAVLLGQVLEALAPLSRGIPRDQEVSTW